MSERAERETDEREIDAALGDGESSESESGTSDEEDSNTNNNSNSTPTTKIETLNGELDFFQSISQGLPSLVKVASVLQHGLEEDVGQVEEEQLVDDATWGEKVWSQDVFTGHGEEGKATGDGKKGGTSDNFTKEGENGTKGLGVDKTSKLSNRTKNLTNDKGGKGSGGKGKGSSDNCCELEEETV